MEQGVAENGVFYYGARHREPIKVEPPPEPVIGHYDPESPDELNARRFFGFTDYEELDIFMLRSRRGQRKGHPLTNYFFTILANMLGK